VDVDRIGRNRRPLRRRGLHRRRRQGRFDRSRYLSTDAESRRQKQKDSPRNLHQLSSGRPWRRSGNGCETTERLYFRRDGRQIHERFRKKRNLLLHMPN
jgi:hypothetical protein